MTLANIHLPPNTVLDPKLDELVQKLALDMPQHTFTTKGLGANEVSYYSNSSAVGKRDHKPPEGMKFLARVNVYTGSEQLGSLFLDTRYSRSNGTETVWVIKSWRIETQRGNMNETRTTKLGGAVRVVKRSFVPQNNTELMEKAKEAMFSGLVGVVRDLTRPIQHAALVPNHLVSQRYLFALMRGEPVDPNDEELLRRAYTAEKYETAWAEFNLARKMSEIELATVVLHEGIVLYRFRDTSPIFRKHMEELSLDVQNAISVLQLMEDGELVDDVGFRFNPTHMLIPTKLFAQTAD